MLLLACLFLTGKALALEIADGWVKIGPAYRQDRLHWNIAGPGGSPNVFSELKWSRLQIAQAALEGYAALPSKVFARGCFSYGYIYDGHVRDSDFAGNNRTLLFARSHSQADKGKVWDLTIAGGYPLIHCPNHFSLSPLAGYSYHEQRLRIMGGQMRENRGVILHYFTDTLNSSTSRSSHSWVHHSLEGIDSTYVAQWSGPWVGLDALWHMTPSFDLFVAGEFHWARYRGRGHWNLRSDFADDFRHRAHGLGFVTTAAVAWHLSSHWSLTISALYQHWHAHHGTDRTFIFANAMYSSAPSGEVLEGKLPLNGVTWESCNIAASIAYRF